MLGGQMDRMLGIMLASKFQIFGRIVRLYNSPQALAHPRIVSGVRVKFVPASGGNVTSEWSLARSCTYRTIEPAEGFGIKLGMQASSQSEQKPLIVRSNEEV